ncbi:hypothetical protein KAT36_00540 [Candidatus Pacearchaeota archaeon]|nr:hypothetical protein [Candidatus Pacearchaeota archaeon]
MTILTMNRKELEKKIGKVTPELENRITDMGTSGGVSPQVMGGRSLSLVGGRLNVARFERAIWRNKG